MLDEEAYLKQMTDFASLGNYAAARNMGLDAPAAFRDNIEFRCCRAEVELQAGNSDEAVIIYLQVIRDFSSFNPAPRISLAQILLSKGELKGCKHQLTEARKTYEALEDPDQRNVGLAAVDEISARLAEARRHEKTQLREQQRNSQGRRHSNTGSTNGSRLRLLIDPRLINDDEPDPLPEKNPASAPASPSAEPQDAAQQQAELPPVENDAKTHADQAEVKRAEDYKKEIAELYNNDHYEEAAHLALVAGTIHRGNWDFLINYVDAMIQVVHIMRGPLNIIQAIVEKDKIEASKLEVEEVCNLLMSAMEGRQENLDCEPPKKDFRPYSLYALISLVRKEDHEAERRYAKAVDMFPQNPDLLGGYGCTLYLLGDTKQACRVFHYAMQLDDIHPDTPSGYASTLLSMKRADLALVVINKGLKLFPENENLKKNREKALEVLPDQKANHAVLAEWEKKLEKELQEMWRIPSRFSAPNVFKVRPVPSPF